jgi:hypothetical protein
MRRQEIPLGREMSPPRRIEEGEAAIVEHEGEDERRSIGHDRKPGQSRAGSRGQVAWE